MDRRNRKMDPTERKITKIAREAGKFTVQAMKEEGIGTAEFDFIHLVRHHPGITQTEVREQLKIDKGAAARRAASLETKGYLIRKPNPWDGRSQLLYATEKAESLKNSKAEIETFFYEWLLAELPEKEAESFCETLDKLYWKSKRERQNHFAELSKILREKAEEERKNKISNIQPGFVTEGIVESLQPYGAFVDLGNGVSGLVHISQICEKRIRKPSEVLAVGDKVKVKVTAVKDGKLSLSIKEATDMMAKEVEEEEIEIPQSGEEATTSLGSLFANIKLN